MNTRFHAMLLVSSVALFAQSTVHAQSAGSEFGTPLEEITVTAQRREQSLRDVPISMSVATKEQLDRDQVYTLVDLQRVAPGLEMSPTFGAEQNGGGRVRGIGTNLFSEGASSSVAVVVDQMPSGNVAMPEIFDMAQAEVLRGPQGTLFGQSASAGVINISTQAPDPNAFSAELGADYQFDDYEQRIIRGAVNIPVSENSALRIAGRVSHIEGAKTNRALGQDNEDDITSLRVRFRTEPSDSLSVDLIAEYHDKENSDNFFNLGVAPQRSIFLGPNELPPQAQLASLTACGDAGQFEVNASAREYCSERMPALSREWKALGAIVDWDLGGHTLTSVTSYREKNHSDDYRNYSRAYGQVLAQVYHVGYDGEQIAQELRLASNDNENFNYIIGAYFSGYDSKTFPSGGTVGDLDDPAGFVLCNYAKTFCLGPPPPIGPIWPEFTFSEVNSSTQAIFADGETYVNGNMSVFGGVRFTKHESDFAVGVNGPYTNFGNSENNETSGRLGLRWGVGENGSMYASMSQGFKPSFVDIQANPGVPVTVLRPEINTSYEVGGKFSIADGRLSLDGALFFMDVEDYQASSQEIINNELVSIPTNIPTVESYGVELSLYGSIGDSLSVNAGYLYNVAEYPTGFISDDGVDIGGEQLAQSPEQKLTVSGEWFTPVGSSLEAFVNLNAIYVSDIRFAQRAQAEYVYSGHMRWGGSLGVRSADGQWTARLYGRNLGDEPFPLAALASQFAGQENGGIRLWTFPGVSFRQVGLSVDVNF